jgi:hypothetical protein
MTGLYWPKAYLPHLRRKGWPHPALHRQAVMPLALPGWWCFWLQMRVLPARLRRLMVMRFAA